MLKKVRFIQKKSFFLATLIWGIGLPQYTFAAEEPDNFQLKVIEPYQDEFDGEILNKYQKGVFDLSQEKSTFVSVATQSLIGTSPGIRTIATVNNDEGELRACSSVTIHYQIIDIDGDWDSDKSYENAPAGNGDTYYHFKTSDTILWSIKINTAEGEEIFPLPTDTYGHFISKDKLTLNIPEKITVKGVEYSTEGATLIYQLVPHTMIGSNPYTIGNDESVESLESVVVNDLTHGKFLMPGEESGAKAAVIVPQDILKDVKDTEVDSFNKLKGHHYLTFPGLPNPEGIENQSFIREAVIQAANPDECLVQQSPVEVDIYAAKDPNKANVIQVGAWSGRPFIFVKNRYQAEVTIKDDKGTTRSLTRKEFEDKKYPFTWNLYYSENVSECPVTEENLNNPCLERKSFSVPNEADSSSRFGAVFIEQNGVEVLDYAWIDLQAVNDNKLVNSAEGSEQGAIVSVSFGYDQ